MDETSFTDSFSYGQSTYKKVISIFILEYFHILYKLGLQMTSIREMSILISVLLFLLSLEDQIDLLPSTGADW